MSKLFLLCAIIISFDTSFKAQQVNDTLRYFLYKQNFKLPPTTPATAHPFFKSPATAVSGYTNITHVGSVFKNKDAGLMVYGLEARVLVPNLVKTGPDKGGVPFRLYLCNVVNGIPVFPLLDSVYFGVSATQPSQNGLYVGATFTNGPVNVSGDFAVLGKCISGQSGDSIKFFRTAGHTATSTTAPSLAHKFGEGLGVVRKNGTFTTTTNFNDPNFGLGTDYEFCMSPMVTFTLQVSQKESVTLEGACEWEVFTNTSTSSPEFTNRQFNFNEFFRELKPFDPNSPVATSFTPDSVLAWDVGDGQPLFYLPPGLDSIHLAYAAGICNQFFTGSITGKYKQSAYNVNAQTITTPATFTGSCVWCNDSAGSGLQELGQLARLKIFPNPTSDKTIISGLEGANTIYVYNMMGQLILSENVKEETVWIDLSKQAQGTYLVKINNTFGNTRIVKVIKQQ